MINIRPASSPPPRAVSFTVGEVIAIVLLLASAFGGWAVVEARDREHFTRIGTLEDAVKRQIKTYDSLLANLHSIDVRLSRIEARINQSNSDRFSPTPSPP